MGLPWMGPLQIFRAAPAPPTPHTQRERLQRREQSCTGRRSQLCLLKDHSHEGGPFPSSPPSHPREGGPACPSLLYLTPEGLLTKLAL